MTTETAPSLSPHLSSTDAPPDERWRERSWGDSIWLRYEIGGIEGAYEWNATQPLTGDLPGSYGGPDRPVYLRNGPTSWSEYVNGKNYEYALDGLRHDEALFKAVTSLQINPGFALLDQYDHAEGHPVDFGGVFRAHVLRCLHGWRNETALHRYLCQNPFLVSTLGFDSIPDQSTLWRAWNERFTEPVREAIRTAAERLTPKLRDLGYALPDCDFRPKHDIDGDSERIERRVR